MDFDIPDELQLLSRTVRDFVETRLAPIEKQVGCVMANISINFVMKATYSSAPVFITVEKAP